MTRFQIVFILSLVGTALSVNNCTSNVYNCPASGQFNVCAGDSLQTNIIIRCVNGCPEPGNCNDNLAGVPPGGVKTFAPCYQDSPTAGNAQCTYNCVLVTKLDGTTFYPVGCTSSSSSSSVTSSSSTSSGSSSSVKGSSSSSSSGSVSSTASTSGSKSGSASATSSSSGGSGGSSVTRSTTTYTSTLPGGSVTTGTSVVAIATSSPITLSNDAAGINANALAALVVAGLIVFA